ncbi:hypothetical protein Q4603_09295 [Zobellia galactanivorans]|uniref:Conserved hypothetical membrane protein n=1 Tax=Zobellia galactanivorans (strain DSM 12802 / CCUG 47099 / CIP 106680 / NCIMB 13871 / Dsij) TaxID=63186 RepID=G0KZJ5_ZOBGA|nr:hypothetical protein [Zobellia galactanivorans]MBU3024896.1 hypothetical protein [Zobellia galactanivorans]MDO6808806.1 hypothetical protein [Zobellia galactanivorans]CAZ98417.1 Conserved hypothetical membrane protein [Zobellia galactanivorans]
MMYVKNFIPVLFFACFTLIACKNSKKNKPENPETYTGTASVSQGPATVLTQNIFECDRGRKAPIGTSTATDGSQWTVPAEVNFTDDSFPFASDLFNPCTKVEYRSADEALAALDGTDIIEVDADGELITAYVFADNYFEMYINGVPVGKDNVPFTQFNSNILRFKVNRPFTIAMKLVDWEENSGLGSEANRGQAFHPGDGGMVAVFKDAKGDIIATTNSDWKAQTFYTAPLRDLSCASEQGSLRLSDACSTEDSNDGTSYYALHWKTPLNWQSADFDDGEWPNATEFTNNTIGVDNKPAYTNFTDVFDNSAADARFIWSTNVILDNEVLVRYTVD